MERTASNRSILFLIVGIVKPDCLVSSKQYMWLARGNIICGVG